jgi:hypothetical protein
VVSIIYVILLGIHLISRVLDLEAFLQQIKHLLKRICRQKLFWMGCSLPVKGNFLFNFIRFCSNVCSLSISLFSLSLSMKLLTGQNDVRMSYLLVYFFVYFSLDTSVKRRRLSCATATRPLNEGHTSSQPSLSSARDAFLKANGNLVIKYFVFFG